MAYPPKPTIQTSYTAVEQMLGDGSFPGQQLDVDLANLKLAVDALNDFIRGLSRSDGRLANGSVTRDTLGADILLGIAPPEPWQAGKVYRTPDSVFEGNRFYLALQEHTSSVFADDLASGRWVVLADFTVVQAVALAAQAGAEAARDTAVAARDDVVERYLGAFVAAPTLTPSGSPIGAGALYFDLTELVLYVFDGVRWLSASSSIEAVRKVFTFVATSGQTVFSGADEDAQVLVIDNSALTSVFLNGVRLVDGTDYTLDSVNDSVTLTTGAALNDVVQIEAFGNLNTRITVSDQPPTGGAVGDLWFQYGS